MSNPKRSLTILVTALLLSFSFGPAFSAESNDDELLNLIPADVLFCVRINNFDYTAGQLDQFLAGASPMPLGISMMARMQLAQLFGSPELAGINTAGNFAAGATLEPGSTQPNVFFLFPITDYKQFVDGNPNVSAPDGNGISTVTVMQAPKGRTLNIGNYAVMFAPEDDAKTLAKKFDAATGLTSKLSAAQNKAATAERIWAYVDIEQIAKTYGPVMTAAMEEQKAELKRKIESGECPPSMGDPNKAAQAIEMQAKMFKAILDESKSVTVAVNPQMSVLSISASLTAMDGSEMAGMFTGPAAPAMDKKMLGYLEDGMIANAATNFDPQSWANFNKEMMQWVGQMMGQEIGSEDWARMVDITVKMAEQTAGKAAMSFSANAQAKPPFAVKYVVALKNTEKYMELFEQSVTLWDSNFSDMYSQMGIKQSFSFESNIDTYKDVLISKMRFSMKMTDANSPEAMMINTMYGEGFDYRYGIVDKNLLMTIGGNPDASIRKLIDVAKAGGPTGVCSEVTEAMKLIPNAEKANFFATLNLIRAVSMVKAFIPMPIPIPALPDVPTNSNLAFAGRVGEGTFTLDIAVPKQHLTEITTVFQKMQQQQQMQQMDQNQPPSMPPPPPTQPQN